MLTYLIPNATQFQLNFDSTSFQPQPQINLSLNINLNSTSTLTSTQYGCDIKATQSCSIINLFDPPDLDHATVCLFRVWCILEFHGLGWCTEWLTGLSYIKANLMCQSNGYIMSFWSVLNSIWRWVGSENCLKP